MVTPSLPVRVDGKTWPDRFLSLVADVHSGEAVTALMLASNIFLLLTSYYIIRPVREALILTGSGGAEIKSYAGAFHAVLFLFIVPAYGTFASKVNRIRLINWVSLIFASNLVVFYVLGRAGVPLGIPFFLWVGIFNLMVVAHVVVWLLLAACIAREHRKITAVDQR